MDKTGILSKLIEREGRLFMPQSHVRFEHLLRRSALSESYLVHHEGLNLPCILRVMKPEIAEQFDEEADEGFSRACQQYARVRHPSITAMYDIGEYAGMDYVIIEYVTGIPLTERIKDRPLTDVEALKLMTPIADGLAALWRVDYIHRGVSPLRVLIASDGTPKLDLVVLPRIALNPLLIEAHSPFMAGFWPPEELRQSTDIDARSDMFSFGASFYYAVTGMSPFGKGSRTELIARTMSEPPTPPQKLNPQLRQSLCDFLMRCLQREPKDRFSSTQEFLDALHAEKSQLCKPAAPRPSTFGPLVDANSKQSTFQVDDTIGQCRLEQMVGAGAFGVVYKARHQLLDMPVAVKFLPTELAEKYPEYVDLFLREARTAIRIRHKNVIGLYEAGVQGGQYFLIMEYAPGGSVQDRMEKLGGMLPEDEVIRLLREAALGLSAAEEMNIIHRDIKPANLMYGGQQEIKIADLGLAKRLLVPSLDGGTQASIRQDQLTMKRGDNAIQGTPAYMAPEMALTPDKVDCRCDLYSLGVTAYQLLTGQLPFEGTEALQILMKHVTQVAPAPRSLNPKVSPELESIVNRLMAKSPADRFQTSAALRVALDSLR
jgi:eukaryotic-like serine/threonine-protein kinase